jgi:hypothetical protein
MRVPLHAAPCKARHASTRQPSPSGGSRYEQVSGSSPLVGSMNSRLSAIRPGAPGRVRSAPHRLRPSSFGKRPIRSSADSTRSARASARSQPPRPGVPSDPSGSPWCRPFARTGGRSAPPAMQPLFALPARPLACPMGCEFLRPFSFCPIQGFIPSIGSGLTECFSDLPKTPPHGSDLPAVSDSTR